MDKQSIKVLLIDSSSVVAHFVARSLLVDRIDIKFEMDNVSSLAAAKESLAQTSYSVILLALMLPDCKGWEAFDLISKHAPKLPIIILSANDDDALALQALKKGAQDYLIKTRVGTKKVARAICFAIERKRIENELKQTTRELSLAKENAETLNQQLEKTVERANQIIMDNAPAKTTALSISDEHVKRILIVDDSKINRLVSKHMLEKNSYSVDTATNGEEAIEILSSKTYDIVLMDMQMPVMDGLEATRIIRNSSSSVLCHDVPIIAMTAATDEDERKLCFDAGMSGFSSKPLDIEVLLKIIAEQQFGKTKQ